MFFISRFFPELLEMEILSDGLTLLLIMDPLGNIPVFLSTLKTAENESRKRKILIRELLIALIVLLVFYALVLIC